MQPAILTKDQVRTRSLVIRSALPGKLRAVICVEELVKSHMAALDKLSERAALPNKKVIIPPKGGWYPNTYYVVEVSFGSTNPIHRKIFYSGFLNGKTEPAGYNSFFSADRLTIKDVHYMKVLDTIEWDIDSP